MKIPGLTAQNALQISQIIRSEYENCPIPLGSIAGFGDDQETAKQNALDEAAKVCWENYTRCKYFDWKGDYECYQLANPPPEWGCVVEGYCDQGP